MKTAVFLVTVDGSNVVRPQTGLTPGLYAWQSASPYYDSGNKIGDFTELGNGLYEIDVTTGVKGTVVSAGSAVAGQIGRWFEGEDQGSAGF